jgi:hypothetical protein
MKFGEYVILDSDCFSSVNSVLKRKIYENYFYVSEVNGDYFSLAPLSGETIPDLVGNSYFGIAKIGGINNLDVHRKYCRLPPIHKMGSIVLMLQESGQILKLQSLVKMGSIEPIQDPNAIAPIQYKFEVVGRYGDEAMLLSPIGFNIKECGILVPPHLFDSKKYNEILLNDPKFSCISTKMIIQDKELLLYCKNHEAMPYLRYSWKLEYGAKCLKCGFVNNYLDRDLEKYYCRSCRLDGRNEIE